MKLDNVFEEFLTYKKNIKTVSIASVDKDYHPNSAPKMFVDAVAPNKIFFLDYKFTQTFANLQNNPHVSISYMNDPAFIGYRLNGTASVLESGDDFAFAKQVWSKKLISYEAERVVTRIRGGYSTKEAENSLPRNFVIVRFLASAGSIVKPDRILRA